jgi:hypothetical protein
MMSTRLQVLLDEEEMRELRELAQRRGVTVSQLVRSALRDARRREPGGSLATKLDAIRAAAAHEFPTADIDQMLIEIERGYGSGSAE